MELALLGVGLLTPLWRGDISLGGLILLQGSDITLGVCFSPPRATWGMQRPRRAKKRLPPSQSPPTPSASSQTRSWRSTSRRWRGRSA